LSAGAELEFRDYRSSPRDLFDRLSATSRASLGPRTYPSVFVSASWSNALRPTLAISNEDGIQVAISARQRWRADSASATRSNSVVGVLTGFRSVDLPGFAHHVIALRAAAAYADEKATGEIDAGGVSGEVLTIVPGVTLGQGRRNFPVRGFDTDAQQGIRALGGSAEYRIPVWLPSSGLGSLPLFFQRVSALVFTDAATSWCPAGITGSVICPKAGTAQDWMASSGAELQVDAAYDYDSPYRFRIGIATPIKGRKYFGSNNIAIYFALGIPF
jgi:hypothetical protein